MFFKKVDRIILFFYEEKYHKSLAKQRKNICDTLRLCERKIAYPKSFDKKRRQ